MTFVYQQVIYFNTAGFHYLVIIYTEHRSWANWGPGLVGVPHIEVTGEHGKSGDINLGG